MNKEQQVIIRKKSMYQKDDCFFCEKESTLEADCGNVSIRCCVDHIEDAKDFAKHIDKEM
jgi:hypothetical protein